MQRHLDVTAAGQPRRSLDPVDLVLLEQQLDAAGEPGDHLVLARVNCRHVDADAATGSIPARPHSFADLRDLERMRVLEQRLGGDTSPDETRAAQRFLFLDDRHLETELRRSDRGHIPAGPCANDDHVIPVCQRTTPFLTAPLEQHRTAPDVGATPQCPLEGETRQAASSAEEALLLLDARQRHEGLLNRRLRRGALLGGRSNGLDPRLQLAVLVFQFPVLLGQLAEPS